MKIPARLNRLLQRNPALLGAVYVNFAEFSPWFNQNRLVFFPEYTDHGPNHINDVLIAAEGLISDNAWKCLTPEDAAVLILAVQLHDCAMHLAEDGFLQLLKAKNPATNIFSFKDPEWGTLWNGFLHEAARWDDRTANKIFGASSVARNIPESWNDWKPKHYLLIGEFLRRYHPRLAFEIALGGVPGPTPTRLSLRDLPEDFPELVGFVARSHGYTLRTFVDLIRMEQRRELRSIHLPFLMGVLRIADYLQLHSERAPKQLLKVRSLRSPISMREHEVHLHIRDINTKQDDPESIFVEADPKNVHIFLKQKKLFSSIQSELDETWAVFGENYGRVKELKKLAINIRRIKSNLDDLEKFSKHNRHAFIPSEAKLDSAGVELLKLLIEPLYGNKPDMGLRELIQNSVDACRELEDFRTHDRTKFPYQPPEQEANVLVKIVKNGDGTGKLIILDQGIGMTVDVIRNYFLKVGASFRKSEEWKKQHADEHLKSRVLRSGKFGIGVLAAFLLGKQMRVITRHLTNNDGIEFTCRIEDEVIELRKVATTTGTIIEIDIDNPEIMDRFGYYNHDMKWDLYCLDEPSVKIIYDGDLVLQKFHLPKSGSQLDHMWRRINHEQYEDIQWTYWRDVPLLTCNGIQVTPISREISYELYNQLGWRVLAPHLSIFDPDGVLPLNLQRDYLSDTRLTFNDELLRAVCRDFIAFLLVNLPESPGKITSQRYRGISFGYRPEMLWFHPRGFCLYDSWNLHATCPQSVVFTNLDNHSLDQSHVRPIFESGKSFMQLNFSRYPSINLWDFVFRSKVENVGFIAEIPIDGLRVMIPNTKSIISKDTNVVIGGEKLHKDAKLLQVEWENENWIILSNGKCPTSPDTFQEIAKSEWKNFEDGFAECYFAKQSAETYNEFSILGQMWKQVLLQPYIPYDRKTRRDFFSHLYDDPDFKKYIEAHQLLEDEKESKREKQ